MSLPKINRFFQGTFPWRKLLLCLAVLLIAVGGTVGYYFANRYVRQTQSAMHNLEAEQAKLYEALAQQKTELTTQAASDKKTADEALKVAQDKIAALETKIAELEKKVSGNNLKAPPKPPKNTSVYDRIVSDNAEAKQKIIDAIKLVEANTPSYFKIIQEQVQTIQTVTHIGCGGGQQVKRTVYISYTAGNCLTNTPTSTFASVVVHETYHVYNVYVNKVVTSGKAQELPSLYAQRNTFDALGVVQPFRNYVESLIAYYEAQ